MTGIDVVDLQAAGPSRIQDIPFLHKVFTEQESALFPELADALLWTAWSIKEATYKALQYYGIWERFMPRNFEISSLQKKSSDPVFSVYESICAGIPVQSRVYTDHVISLAILPGVDIQDVHIAKYTDEENIKYWIKKIYDLKNSPDITHYESGMPHVESYEQQRFHISISHHGTRKIFAVYRASLL